VRQPQPSSQAGLHLLQSRAITSLYPLPEGIAAEPLQVLMAFSAVQGIMDPLTPLGQDLMKLVLSGGGQVLGFDPDYQTQRTILSAGERLWINITPLLRNSLGRRIIPNVLEAIDPGVAQACHQLVHDPRLAPQRKGIRFDTLRRLASFLLPTFGRVLKIWRHPEQARQRLQQAMDAKVAEAQTRISSSGDPAADFRERLALLHDARDIFPDLAIPQGVTAVLSGLIPFFGVLKRFGEQVAAGAQLHLKIARGLPHNVTTEMDLALWECAQSLRGDLPSAQALGEKSAAELAGDYLNADLPEAAQSAIDAFLGQYGVRAVGEIDIGRPRWREDPSHVIGVLQSYLKINDPSLAPDQVFARGASAAKEAAAQLESQVRRRRGGRFKARLVRWAVSRYRALAGLREAPKFFAIRMIGAIRRGLLQSGEDLTKAGLLARREDIFYLQISELDQLSEQSSLGGSNPFASLAQTSAQLKAKISARRALYQREKRRAQIPRLLLSDGQAFYEGVSGPGDGRTLRGSPVSPGVATGPVKVVFDPQDANLSPGDILVCPGTDPAWTPLFLAAGGLIMEVGGMMTHGSVVAREYGIPAVVGVHQATQRLQSGQQVRLNGSSGQISVLDEVHPE
jgi:pyruvate,water dikinase